MNQTVSNQPGIVTRIAGPVVGVVGLERVRLFDVVYVGELGLVGEVIQLARDMTTIQVYEETAGLRVGEPVYSSGLPLVATLGPGLLGNTYDGLQRPLVDLYELSGDFIARGISAPPLTTAKDWAFSALVKPGTVVQPGDVIGTVMETPAIQHRIMIPQGISGSIVHIADGKFTVEDTVALVNADDSSAQSPHKVRLAHTWPVRSPRPFRQRLGVPEPLVTGMRVIDTFFPVAKGGTAIIPGGFGTGKTVIEQSLARWADVDIVIYVGCGERGNEIAEVLDEFPQITDPYTNLPMMERTVMIANTSNMPVAARVASVYVGITIGEYYRDMGYDVLLLADSTSRWGEALREISGRLEEIPGEEGYPAYLASRISGFYERSGRVECLARAETTTDTTTADSFAPLTGSLTIVGAVSPPGGDFSEPITQSSMSVTGTFWALDYQLSRRRHFPAVNWSQSYTLYNCQEWYTRQIASDWNDQIGETLSILQRADELQRIVQLVGPEALSDSEHLLLLFSQMVQEDFLQQSAFDDIDRFCPLPKTYWMLKALLTYYQLGQFQLDAGISLEQLRSLPEVERLARMKAIPLDQAIDTIKTLQANLRASLIEPDEV